jgi:hypothetical protein
MPVKLSLFLTIDTVDPVAVVRLDPQGVETAERHR